MVEEILTPDFSVPLGTKYANPSMYCIFKKTPKRMQGTQKIHY